MKTRANLGAAGVFLASAAIIVGAASAATVTSADPLQTLYGNTVTVRNVATGDVSTLILQPNHTLTVSLNQNGVTTIRVSALWVLSADNISVCFAPSPIGGVEVPVPAQCLPMTGHVGGDQWTVPSDSGQTLSLSLAPSQ